MSTLYLLWVTMKKTEKTGPFCVRNDFGAVAWVCTFSVFADESQNKGLYQTRKYYSGLIQPLLFEK